MRQSYWFLPGLMALGGLVAALGLVFLDGYVGDAWLGRFEWITGSRPEGARAVLSTVASSTITVAGVVFSITLAAVTYASGQYGPRLLSNFQRDRGNQATLGTFVATYLYCLVVLRTIRSAEEASADTGGAIRDAFVPHIAVYGALLLAIASIAVLVYFVHHVTDGIHINNVIARIGRGLIEAIRARPERDGSPPPDMPGFASACTIHGAGTGYIEAIDHDALVAFACRHDFQFRLLRRAGDFVHAGRPLLQASPESVAGKKTADACNAAFALGRRRTPLQDLRFLFDELVEIAARALSPGIQDPFTAIACLDWLGAALSELDGRGEESVFCDANGVPRLFRKPLDFEDHLGRAFGQLRPYLAADPNARAHGLATLQAVANSVRDPRRRGLVLEERRELEEASTD